MSVKYRRGFTLIEMSVMLVIIGLLVGGILIGQGMIHQSEIRKTLTEVNQFRTSINAFVTQYNGLPGDFKEAEAFWGSASAVNGTQSGDGDKRVEFLNANNVYEGYRAWQHLSRAQLVPGPYSGTVTTGVALPGLDLPRSELTGGYGLESDALGMEGQLVVLLGTPLASSTTLLMEGSLRPEDAYDIDLKVDDGIPEKGVLRGREGENNAVTDCVSAGKYNLAFTQKACFVGFQL